MNFSRLCHEDLREAAMQNPFIEKFNDLIYKLFYSVSMLLNSGSGNESRDALESCQDLLENINVQFHHELEFGIHDFTDLLKQFILNLLSEINQPFSDSQTMLQSCSAQYRLLGEEGLGKFVHNELPVFYAYYLTEILTGFRRYYSEKIRFLREEVIRLEELSDSPDETAASDVYNRLHAFLINESVQYDWQEYKDYVDSHEINREAFYRKYFYWQWIQLREGIHSGELAAISSGVRFAIGSKPGNLTNIIENLPDPGQNLSPEELMNNLISSGDYRKVQTHFPNRFLHQAFDFISRTYIDKFDVQTAKKGLFSYSTEYPWYIRWFSSTSFLRAATLSLIGLMLMAGLFDSNLYSLNGKELASPASIFMEDMLHGTLFRILKQGFSAFWILILAIPFILPVFLLGYLLARKIRKKPGSDEITELKFLELVHLTESNNGNLLYLSFIIPLLFVVLQMANADTVGMINNITGFRLVSTLLIITGLTLIAVFRHVKEKNRYKPVKWLLKSTEHIFWLHLFQALLIRIFITDMLLRLEINQDTFSGDDGLFIWGISKFIVLNAGPLDFVIMPVFSVIVAFLTLFFSFFIDKVLGNKE
jgi:hypothetical protein